LLNHGVSATTVGGELHLDVVIAESTYEGEREKGDGKEFFHPPLMTERRKISSGRLGARTQ
jgi:hypothetical protein